MLVGRGFVGSTLFLSTLKYCVNILPVIPDPISDALANDSTGTLMRAWVERTCLVQAALTGTSWAVVLPGQSGTFAPVRRQRDMVGPDVDASGVSDEDATHRALYVSSCQS